jgi:hypothetical protein
MDLLAAKSSPLASLIFVPEGQWLLACGFAEQATPQDQNHRESSVSLPGYQQALAHLN